MVPQLQKKQKIPSVTGKLCIAALSILNITAVIAVILSDVYMGFRRTLGPVRILIPCVIPQKDPIESSSFVLVRKLVRTLSDIGVLFCRFLCVTW